MGGEETREQRRRRREAETHQRRQRFQAWKRSREGGTERQEIQEQGYAKYLQRAIGRKIKMENANILHYAKQLRRGGMDRSNGEGYWQWIKEREGEDEGMVRDSVEEAREQMEKDKKKYASHIIQNDGTLDNFHSALQEYYQSLSI